MAQLTPYLSFDNKQCREAMQFYKDCLGGELTLQTVSSMPEMASMMSPGYGDHIMHATLTSGGITILASDLNRDKMVEGNMCYLCVHCDNEAQLNEWFSKLAEGGAILQAIGDVPWGALYGELTDKFGKRWMFNFQKG
jgi:PhnB protein